MFKGWIDVHAHLDKLKTSPTETLNQAKAAGVERIITISTGESDLFTVLNLANEFAPFVYCTLGVHPHEAQQWNPNFEDSIRSHASSPCVVGLGEMGLDYYYNTECSKDIQMEAFLNQLTLAKELHLPVEIHSREADQDMISVLSQHRREHGGLLHCFTSSRELAFKALDFGYNISISGIVTFKAAESLREIVKDLPLDRIHIETDAPYLAPVPMRGQENTSRYVVYTAQCVAELKKVSIEELSHQLKENALKLFPKIDWS